MSVLHSKQHQKAKYNITVKLFIINHENLGGLLSWVLESSNVDWVGNILILLLAIVSTHNGVEV